MYGQSILIQVAVCVSCLGLGAQSGPKSPEEAAPVTRTKTSAEKSYAIARTVRVSPGALEVRLLSRSLRKGIAAREIALSEKGGDEIAKLKTRSDGTCTLPVLTTGEYVLELAEGLQLGLLVAKDAVVKKLDIVLKLDVVLKPDTPAKPGDASQLEEPGLTSLEWGLVVAGGAAIAVGVPIAIENHNDSKKSPVSGTGVTGKR